MEYTAVSAGNEPRYDDQIVKMFLIATVAWAVVGMLVGVWIALELAFPGLNFSLPWTALELAWWPANLGVSFTTFGRLRPLHTNAVIFAFAGNVCFFGIYHSMQRLLKARLFSDTLSRLHFWGWQLIILLAAVSLPQAA